MENQKANLEELAYLVMKAKGSDRTMREYASAANVNVSIVSRILAKKYEPGIKVLQKLASESAAPRGNVTVVDLMRAAGYDVENIASSAKSGTNASNMGALGATLAGISAVGGAAGSATTASGAAALTGVAALGKGAALATVGSVVLPIGGAVLATTAAISILGALHGKNRKKMEETILAEEHNQEMTVLREYAKEQRKFRATAIGIIYEALEEKEIVYRPTGLREFKEDEIQPDKCITLTGETIKTWWFQFFSKNDMVFESEQEDFSLIVETLLNQFIFLPADAERKISIVVNDTKIVDAFKKFKGINSYRGNLSVILIDVDGGMVKEEVELAFYDETQKNITNLVRK